MLDADHVDRDGERSSDSQIQDAVRRHLDRLMGLNASGIRVTVSDGTVTLDGTVRENWDKLVAETAARAVRGVRGVDNRLRLVPVHLGREMTSGMTVIDDRRRELGRVAEAFGDSFFMDCLTGERVFVPFSAIQGVADRFVVILPPLSSLELEP